MTTYAALKGRPTPPAPEATKAPAAAAELSADELQAIDANRRFVHEHLQDAIPFIRDLVKVGFMDGWRDVKNCRQLPESNPSE